jgi:F0F1-type ATP synthase assembly protein I
LLEILSAKVGGFAIYLGIMLFLNLYLFFKGRRISKMKAGIPAQVITAELK